MAPLVRQHVDAWLRHVMETTGGTRDAAIASAAPFKGAPCKAPYATYTLATCQQGVLSVQVEDTYIPTEMAR